VFKSALRTRCPLSNHATQLVGLLAELMHPLRVHCQIATDFRDLAFDGIRQFRGWAPRPSPRRAVNDFGLRQSISFLRRILTGEDARCMSSLEPKEAEQEPTRPLSST
jgi:hypothetical protein